MSADVPEAHREDRPICDYCGHWIEEPLQRCPALDELTPAEAGAFLTVDLFDVGVREYARMTDRSLGTVGTLLRWARDKVGGEW
jgi:DNA-directed RNA polymerase specialized sigma24 family protein